MYGQERLIRQIDNSDSWPRFTILVGPAGVDKAAISSRIGKILHADVKTTGEAVSSVREMVKLSYEITLPTVYYIADGDKLSVAAKNAMLKVTEEPPINAYFILGVENLSNVLDTIRSRGTVLYLDNYSVEDLKRYAVSQDPLVTKGMLNSICKIATTPSEVKALMDINIVEFTNFVSSVVDNIAVVSGSNSFKIGNRLSLKTNDKGYDIGMFFNAFIAECYDRIKSGEDCSHYLKGIEVTSNALGKVNSNLSKSNLFDIWLLDIRKAWL